MTNLQRFNFKEEPINAVKKQGLAETLGTHDLPHKDVFHRLIEMDKKAKEEAEKARREIPRTDLDHIQDVVAYMNALMKSNYGEILDLESKCAGPDQSIKLKESEEFKRLKEIVDRNKVAKNFLLYATIYHDIGKPIIRPRHGPEGADIIRDSGYEDRKKFYDLGFHRADIFLMSDLIRFHDYFAMVGTGETSYLTFTEVLYPVTNLSIVVEERFLEYLFLLNLADVAGSIGKVGCEELTRLIHDFELIEKAHNDISAKVYEDIFKKKPGEVNQELHKNTITARDLLDITSELQRLAKNSTSERLRRMLRVAFRTGVEQIDEEKFNSYEQWVREEYVRLQGEYPEVKEIGEWFVTHDITPIIASFRGLSVGQVFHTQFAFICKFDYLLGFIRELFKQMIGIEIDKDKNRRRSPHDLRRDLALCLIKLIYTLVGLFGGFTLNNTRIGLGFERFAQMEKEHREKLLRRLTGEDGVFKEAEACTKIRNSTNLWIVTP